MCPGYCRNHKFYGFHHLLIVIFLFPWLKAALSYDLKSNIDQLKQRDQFLNSKNQPPISPQASSQLELALKNTQPAELQLIKIKRFYDQNKSFANNNTLKNKFKINANTIIRTQDSRANGAKYLNETELTSNDDCLKWCLQTKQCNLAVYEEKVMFLNQIFY